MIFGRRSHNLLAPLFSLGFTLCLSLSAITAFADRAVLITDDTQTAHAWLKVADSAKKELIASYFILRNDSTSMNAVAMLLKKAREGVRVRLIIDALHCFLDSEMLDYLSSNGVEIVTWHERNTLFSRGLRHPFQWANHRLHDKYICADGERCLGGSGNIGDDHLHARLKERSVRRNLDEQLYFEGATARKVSEYFDAMWKSEHVSRPYRRKPPKLRLAPEKRLAPYRRFIDRFLKTVPNGADTWEKSLIETDPVEFIHDDFNAKARGLASPGITDEVFKMIAEAKHEVVIQAPYMVFSKRFENVLQGAIDRGVRVVYCSNAPASSDSPVSAAMVRKNAAKYAALGVEIWENLQKDTRHEKSIVVDREKTGILTFNFDPRSENLNTETGFVVPGKEFAERTLAAIRERQKKALRVPNDPSVPFAPHQGIGCVPRTFWSFMSRVLTPLF